MHSLTDEPKRVPWTWWSFQWVMIIGMALSGLAGCSNLPRNHGTDSSDGGHGSGCH